MPAPKGYSRTQIRLHWIAAVLIVVNILFEDPIGNAWEAIEKGGAASYSSGVALHVFGGLAVLAFALWRLALRASRGVPPAPAAEPAPLRMAAHLGHLALYALMILAPVSGAMAWFGGVEAAAEVHEVFKPLFILLVGVHVLAVLWHQFRLKDGLLLRMKQPLD